MEAFVQHRGIAVSFAEDNVDTDQIIPSREMTRVSKLGLGAGLFAGRRYLYDGKEKIGLNPDFVLNRPQFAGASILLGGRNFGCGSSREHAVWALRDFGIDVIIAESFGRIFRNNCARNGLLAITLASADIEELRVYCEQDPRTHALTINLEDSVITARDRYRFEIDQADRHMLLNGLDYIDYTLQYASDISEFIAGDRAQRGWAYL